MNLARRRLARHLYHLAYRIDPDPPAFEIGLNVHTTDAAAKAVSGLAAAQYTPSACLTCARTDRAAVLRPLPVLPRAADSKN